MTPKEKAIQLIERYRNLIKYDSNYNLQWNDPSPCKDSEKRHQQATMDAKKYALVCCDEVILQESFWINNTKKGNSAFWKQVKKELKRM